MGSVESYQIWIPYLRFCRVSEDTVEITPPILFGRGFVFDRVRQKVLVSRRFLGIRGSNIEVPFSDTSCQLQNQWHSGEMYDWNDYKDVNVRGKVLLMLNNDPQDDPKLFEGKQLKKNSTNSKTPLQFFKS